MSLQRELQLLMTRRQLLGRTAWGIGAVALASTAWIELSRITTSPLTQPSAATI